MGRSSTKNLTQTGAQDKKNKNQKQREFFRNLARKNSNQNAITDVLIRDMEQSSWVMREHGQTKPVHRCSVCHELGHHRNSQKCPKVLHKGKFIDMSKLDARYVLSDSDTDSSLDSEVSEISVQEETASDLAIVTVEDIDDLELEEALASSPLVSSNVDTSCVMTESVSRRLSMPGL